MRLDTSNIRYKRKGRVRLRHIDKVNWITAHNNDKPK